ncbi:hypothetical protein HYQ46_005462 [Verticillium longisporum]|nr:hypothetical protein HYQ46_005462 [Verticillium longisporum]
MVVVGKRSQNWEGKKGLTTSGVDRRRAILHWTVTGSELPAIAAEPSCGGMRTRALTMVQDGSGRRAVPETSTLSSWSRGRHVEPSDTATASIPGLAPRQPQISAAKTIRCDWVGIPGGVCHPSATT